MEQRTCSCGKKGIRILDDHKVEIFQGEEIVNRDVEKIIKAPGSLQVYCEECRGTVTVLRDSADGTLYFREEGEEDMLSLARTGKPDLKFKGEIIYEASSCLREDPDPYGRPSSLMPELTRTPHLATREEDRHRADPCWHELVVYRAEDGPLYGWLLYSEGWEDKIDHREIFEAEAMTELVGKLRAYDPCGRFSGRAELRAGLRHRWESLLIDLAEAFGVAS